MSRAWRSRKLWVMLLVFVTSTALLWFGRVASAEWVDLTKWAFAVYAAGNVGAKFANGKGGQDGG